MDENKLSTEFETYFTSAKQASTLSLQKGKNSAIIDGAQTITEEYPPVMLNQSTNDETSLLCNDCDCDSDCNHFNDMSTAINLSLNSWHSGEICCPGQEVWYKFTPTATAYYTFYTVGVLDTTGYLYDADGSQIDTDANNGTGTNFKIVAYLTAGETYYLKTTAFDNSTGSFSIAVTNTVFVDYISIDQSYVSLNKGETEALTVTVSPSYATNKNLYWTSSNTSVATVSQTGVVTATGAGTACICAYSQDGSNKSSCCTVTVDEEQENNPPSDGYIGNYADFLEVLGFRESTSNYSCISATGYLGMYQMGSDALIDAGFKDSNGNWTSLAASYGVTSNATFLSSPDAQEYAVRAYHKKTWGYLEYYDYQSILGRTYYGVIVTESGLLAAAHLVGAYGITDAIKNNTNIQDGLGTRPYEYMDLMKNFDISEIK